MGKSVNRAIILGNLCRDPEIKMTQSSVPVANFTVATSERWKDKTSGEWMEKSEFHRVVAWRHLAELAEKYLQKGAKAYVEGRIETRKWQGKDGQDRYTTEIVASEIVLLSEKKTAENFVPSGDDDSDPLPF